ncbi:MAG: hypothetical protein PW735_03480 [Acidobacteriaceae bacterium]|nr:hypothetical protein [Acidobacteriaceae bacterium]
MTNPPNSRRGMLPGMAGIALFLLLLTLLNTFAAIRGFYGAGASRTGALALCSLLLAGVLGLLRLRRWGWALVTGGCLLLSLGDLFFFSRTHAGFFLIRALLELCFFLYLVRADVRERVH